MSLLEWGRGQPRRLIEPLDMSATSAVSENLDNAVRTLPTTSDLAERGAPQACHAS